MKVNKNDIKNGYSRASCEELKKIKETLMTNSHIGHNRQRIEIINELLVNGGFKEPLTTPTLDTTNFEVYLANKFVNKYKSASSRNIEFNLTFSQYKALMKRKKCFYTGTVLLDKVEAEHPDKRTLDRVDNTLGYTKSNTVVCTHKANQLKNHIFEDQRGLKLTPREFSTFCKNVLSIQNN